jgi:splicing factor U2AF subunit
MQQQQLAALQQQQLHQHIMAQQLLGVQQPHGGGGPGASLLANNESAAMALDRKQREVYVGNLAIGAINGQLLEEFFDQALSHMVPDPVAAPPVTNVNMDGQGRFAFVEFRTRELASHAILMDKLVEVCGRHLHIGRPKGYSEPTGPPLPLPDDHAPRAPRPAGPADPLGKPPPPPGPPPTRALLLSNVLPAGQLRDEEGRKVVSAALSSPLPDSQRSPSPLPDSQRSPSPTDSPSFDASQLAEEVREEAARHGEVEGVAVPPPPASMQDRGPGRAYVLYRSVADAVRGRAVFHGRTLDESRIKAFQVHEAEHEVAAGGGWALRQHSVAGVPLPGLYTRATYLSGVSGLTALNPALAQLVQSNPAAAAAMTAGIDEDEVPFEEGWVKLRGFPPAVTKRHVAEFFAGCGEVGEGDVRMVLSADGTPLGEAFVHLRGEQAKLRLALARDRAPLPPVGAPAEVLTSFEEDMHRRIMSGCQLA